MTVHVRYWAKVDRRGVDDCWPWTGKLKDGYGNISLDREPEQERPKRIGAHVFAYTLACGDIPEGLQVDHMCRNRACQNPRHLRAVTIAVNVLAGIGPCAQNKRKTHCKRGHELTGENLKTRKDGHRQCRECQRLRLASPKFKAQQKERRARDVQSGAESARHKRWQDKNRTHVREYAREWQRKKRAAV